MSSGGSNYSTGATGGGNQVSVDAPASNPASYTNAPAPAPGGKGGFPSAQNPYAQQQPQMYMPPQQPSMYQQAFPQQQRSYVQSNFYAPQQQYGGNAYARPRPYSPPSPIEARPPMDEMNYAPGGFGPGQIITAKPTSGSWGSRRLNPDDFQPLVQPIYAGSNPYTDDMRPTYAGPTSQTGPVTGGPGATDPRGQMNYALGRFDSNAPKPMPESNGPIMSYPGGSRNWNQQFEGRPSYYNGSGTAIEPAPVAATQGVRPEPNYSGGLGSLMSGMSGSMQVPAASQDVVNRKLQALNQGFGAPAQPLDWINTPNGRLWNA